MATFYPFAGTRERCCLTLRGSSVSRIVHICRGFPFVVSVMGPVPCFFFLFHGVSVFREHCLVSWQVWTEKKNKSNFSLDSWREDEDADGWR